MAFVYVKFWYDLPTIFLSFTIHNQAKYKQSIKIKYRIREIFFVKLTDSTAILWQYVGMPNILAGNIIKGFERATNIRSLITVACTIFLMEAYPN